MNIYNFSVFANVIDLSLDDPSFPKFPIANDYPATDDIWIAYLKANWWFIDAFSESPMLL